MIVQDYNQHVHTLAFQLPKAGNCVVVIAFL